MDIEVTSASASDAEIETLKKNIVFYCSTPRGSLPQMRSYGLDFTIFDEPYQTFKVRATVDIVTALREQFGVRAESVDISQDTDGKTQIKISI